MPHNSQGSIGITSIQILLPEQDHPRAGAGGSNRQGVQNQPSGQSMLQARHKLDGLTARQIVKKLIKLPSRPLDIEGIGAGFLCHDLTVLHVRAG